MSSRKSITIALVGMIVLVIVGWLARGAADGAAVRETDPGHLLETGAVQSRSFDSFIIDADG